MSQRRKRERLSGLTLEERRALLWVKICHLIETHGCSIQGVLGDETHVPFAYTVGLAPAEPELILFGLDHGTAGHTFHEIAGQRRAGKTFQSRSAYTGLVDGPYPLYFKNITDEEERWREHMPAATRWHREQERTLFPVFQVVWPDREGRYPWEAGFEEEFRGGQPLLFEPLEG